MFNSFSTPKPDAGLNNIKSIQRGYVDMINVTTINVTISAVDLSKSIVYITFEGSDIYPSMAMVSAELTSSTNVLLSRNTTNNIGKIIRWTVVTFNNVKSKQSGIATATSTGSVNVNISSVAQSKTLCFVSCTSDSTTTSYSYMLFAADLSSDTVLAISRSNIAHTGTFTHKWQLIEFI